MTRRRGLLYLAAFLLSLTIGYALAASYEEKVTVPITATFLTSPDAEPATEPVIASVLTSTDAEPYGSIGYLLDYQVQYAPRINEISANASTIKSGEAVDIRINVTIPDGSIQAVYVNVTCPNGTLTVQDGSATYDSGDQLWHYVYAPAVNDPEGYYNVSVRAVSDAGAESTASQDQLFYYQPNQPPSLAWVGAIPQSAQLGQGVTLNLQGTDDRDQPSDLTVKINVTNPEGQAVVVNGECTYSASDGYFQYYLTTDFGWPTGWYSVTAIAWDSQGAQSGVLTVSQAFEVVSSSGGGGGGGGGDEEPPLEVNPENETENGTTPPSPGGEPSPPRPPSWPTFWPPMGPSPVKWFFDPDFGKWRVWVELAVPMANLTPDLVTTPETELVRVINGTGVEVTLVGVENALIGGKTVKLVKFRVSETQGEYVVVYLVIHDLSPENVTALLKGNIRVQVLQGSAIVRVSLMPYETVDLWVYTAQVEGGSVMAEFLRYLSDPHLWNEKVAGLPVYGWVAIMVALTIAGIYWVYERYYKTAPMASFFRGLGPVMALDGRDVDVGV